MLYWMFKKSIFIILIIAYYKSTMKIQYFYTKSNTFI